MTWTNDTEAKVIASYSTALDVLPPEIVAQIFWFCLPSKEAREKQPLREAPPFTLSWVSRYWRQICLQSPQLWADISLGHRGSDPEGDARLLELFLKRSANHPLSLQLRYEVDDASDPVFYESSRRAMYVEGMDILFDVVLPSIHRWRVFEVYVLDVIVLQRLFDATGRGAPLLQKLSFSTKYLAFFGNSKTIDFSLCPNLQVVRVSTPMISPASQSAMMTKLTSLDLCFCTSQEDCMLWMSLCPNIEKIQVRLFYTTTDFGNNVGIGTDWAGDGRRAGTLHFPKLRTLEIQGFSTEADLRALLNNLHVPNLKRFVVNLHELVDMPGTIPILGFLRQSRPSLESFELSGTSLNDLEIINCLELLPNLKQLTIGQRISRDVLCALTLSDADIIDVNNEIRSLCPKLEEFDLVDASFPIDFLERMVMSRSQPLTDACSIINNKPILKQLVLHIRDIVTATSLHGIALSLANGLKITNREPDNLLNAFTFPDVVFV